MSGRVKHTAAGAVSYKRQPRLRKRVEFDPQEAARLLEESLINNRRPVTGKCYDCGQAVTGERRFCGPCLAKH